VQGLNPEQRQAVTTTRGPLLVLAGAGSGKTRVITTKIAHLIEDTGLPAKRIVAVTFTNKAAREMHERVKGELSGSSARGLTVTTFHRLGVRLLKEEIGHLGYRRPFSIFDAEDAAGVVRGLMQEAGGFGAEQPQEVAGRISDWKSRLVTPRQALEEAGDESTHRAARLFARYQDTLKAHNAVDFDDLINLPVRILQDFDEVRSRWRERVRHLLVDEYQDINAAQYELVRQLVPPEGNLTVVGDDDQSIYSWRGASPEHLDHLRHDYPDLQVVKLERNYRCSSRILNAANELIANNPHVFEKRLWSDRGAGERIKVLEATDAEHETERVVSALLRHRFQNRTGFGDYAVLYRGNHQARLFEKAFQAHGIPYQVYGGPSFFDRGEIRDLAAYLRLVANPDDDVAFLRAVNTPRRGVGAESLERLAKAAGERGESLFDAARGTLPEGLSKRAAQGLAEFAGLIGDFQERAHGDAPVTALRELVEAIEYRDFLYEKAESEKAAERRVGNIDNLLNWFERFTDEQELEGGDALEGFVQRLTLVSALDRQEQAEVGDQVHMMTLHGAKGLEFPYVFLVGMEEEILPHRNSIETDQVEEERRLCYVGLTRAHYGLTLSWARRRTRYGETLECEPSRFLEELPADELEHHPADPGEQSKDTEFAQASLAHLRELLN
jgi:ATP-dependent DNA helicase Rep